MDYSRYIFGIITVKQLKEYLEEIDDDFIIEVTEHYYKNEESYLRVDETRKKVFISQAL